MKQLQRVFKNSYIEYLRKNIDVSKYSEEFFEYDESQTKALANVYHPDGLLGKLDPTPDAQGDYTSAIAIYEAYENLTPLMASMPNLWVYLSHVDLYPYVQKRWGKVLEGTADETYILNHWHEQKGSKFLRTTFAGLWWHVYITVDECRKDRYELTKMLFKSQDFRTLRFGELGLIRHKDAMIGILEWLVENKDVTEHAFDPRGQYISRYFNMLGGTVNLSFMSKDYFKNELDRIKPHLLSIMSTDDVQNKTIIKN